MAGTPEDPQQFSPSIFLDLPPSPRGDLHSSGEGDVALSFISRMLMEDMDECSLYQQYPDDHPALLTAQQPFAQILSDEATGQGQLHDIDRSQARLFHFQLDSFASDSADQSALVSANMLKMAFLMGMEEANKFLPTITTNSLLLIGTSGSGEQPKKNRRRNDDVDDDSVGRGTACWDRSRNTKLMALVPEVEETGGDMFDQMIVNEFKVCVAKAKNLHWHITISAGKDESKPAVAHVHDHGAAGDMQTLLVHCAQAVGSNDRAGAARLLAQIKKCSSPRGDPNQRLAHCFAQGLAARLAGTGRSLVSKRASSAVEYVRALQQYLESCCFRTTSFNVANWSIVKAIARTGRKRVHIVDYGIDYGMQWPTLLTCLSAMEGGPPEVRITGVDLPQPGFRPYSRLHETGRRLSSCARQLGVPFKYRSIVAARWETVRAGDLDIDPDELLIVNSIGAFRNVMDEGVDGGGDIDGPSPRDVVLGNVREMRPHLFILYVINASYGSPFFVRRFRGALSYYAAVFDMLDATMPRDNERRRLVERDLFGRCALNVVACEGQDRVERPEAYRQWQARCRRAGLRQVPLDPEIVQYMRDKVRRLYHRDFVIDMDHQWLIKGWKGRVLHAMSTWVAHDYST